LRFYYSGQRNPRVCFNRRVHWRFGRQDTRAAVERWTAGLTLGRWGRPMVGWPVAAVGARAAVADRGSGDRRCGPLILPRRLLGQLYRCAKANLGARAGAVELPSDYNGALHHRPAHDRGRAHAVGLARSAASAVSHAVSCRATERTHGVSVATAVCGCWNIAQGPDMQLPTGQLERADQRCFR